MRACEWRHFPGSVFPFILRGVTLYGINCVYVPNSIREQAWALLAAHVPVILPPELAFDIPLRKVTIAATELLDGRLQGRAVVDVNQGAWVSLCCQRKARSLLVYSQAGACDMLNSQGFPTAIN
jgi:hypothetical protein